MAQLVISFAVSYILTRLTQPNGPRLKSLQGFTADYGGNIPLVFGPENRLDSGTVIWATKIRERTHKHKPATDYIFGLIGAALPAQKTYTYDVSFAVLISGNPIRRVRKIWLNKKLAFDAGDSTALVFGPGAGTHKDFDTLRVYQGTHTQNPDPSIEADKGVGNVSGYRGSSYIVIDTLQLANYNNGVPQTVEMLVEEAVTGSLRRVVATICTMAGLDTNLISTSALDGSLRGFIIDDNVSVADSFKPLAMAYNFDVADIDGALRFVPRGRYPSSTVPVDQLGAHDPDQDRPPPITWQRAPELNLPQEVSLTFLDPDRDYQPNTATVRREGGNAQNNIAETVKLVLSVTDGQRQCDLLAWEAWSARQGATTSTDDLREDIKATDVHAFETPTGFDTYRVTRRSRGQNGVIELQLVADRPLLYNSTLPGIPAPVAPTSAPAFHPLNTPVFIEPPADLAGDGAQVWIALAGGSGEFASGGSVYTFDPNWPGVNIYAALADTEAEYRAIGKVDAPSYMGQLSAELQASSGAIPDTGDALQVDLTESGGVLETVGAADAAGGLVNLLYIESGGIKEFLTFQTATATAPYNYDCSTLYRGLHGTDEVSHPAGAACVVIDDALARLPLPVEMIGRPVWFKFPQPGQALADVPSYPFTPSGAGYGTGPGGVPADPTGLTVVTGVQVAMLTWIQAVFNDNVSGVEVYRAPGLGASFGSATLVTSGVAGTSYTDNNLTPGAAYTWFIVQHNAVGGSSPSAGEDATITDQAAGAQYVLLQLSEAVAAGALVSFWNSGGARARNANASVAARIAHGFVLAGGIAGDVVKVYLPGSVITGLSALTPGADLWLDAVAGALTMVDPASTFSQRVGQAVTATTATFVPGPAL